MFACLYSIVFGALLCVFYDIIRATRKAGANSFIAVFIGDIIFWLVSAVSVFLFLVAVTNGEIRGYVLFFCLVGFVFYRLSIGRLTFFVMCWFFSLFVRIWCKLSDSLANFCSFADRKAEILFAKGFKVLCDVKKLLKSIYGMLYTKKDKSKMEYDINE